MRADGRRVVDDLKARGVDFIKIQSLIPRDGYFAAADEAKKLGIVFVGHVPDAVRAAEASNAGQKSIEHFTGIFEACTAIEDDLIKGPKGLGLNVKNYDPTRAKAVIALMAKNQTWQVPTLVWERGQWLVDDIDLSHDPLTKYAPSSWKDHTWPMFVSDIKKDMDTDPLAVRKKFVQMELDMTLAMFRAGVPFMAGTDTAAGVHIFPRLQPASGTRAVPTRGAYAAAGPADGDAEPGEVHGPNRGYGHGRERQACRSRAARCQSTRGYRQHAEDPRGSSSRDATSTAGRSIGC